MKLNRERRIRGGECLLGVLQESLVFNNSDYKAGFPNKTTSTSNTSHYGLFLSGPRTPLCSTSCSTRNIFKQNILVNIKIFNFSNIYSDITVRAESEEPSSSCIVLSLPCSSAAFRATSYKWMTVVDSAVTSSYTQGLSRRTATIPAHTFTVLCTSRHVVWIKTLKQKNKTLKTNSKKRSHHSNVIRKNNVGKNYTAIFVSRY